MLVKPLPYPESEDLVSIWHTAPGLVGYGDLPLSSSMFFTYGEENSVFEALGLWRNGTASITGLGDPEQVGGGHHTWGAPGGGCATKTPGKAGDTYCLLSQAVTIRRRGALYGCGHHG